MKRLPDPPLSFAKKKDRILEQLSIPNSEYTDASPKGSIDAGIRDLIDEINGLDGFVTTSSCAGRVSVFVEGKKTLDLEPQQVRQAGEGGDRHEQEQERANLDTLAGVGGKGGGGSWLFVSHDPVAFDESMTSSDLDVFLGLGNARGPEQPRVGNNEFSEDTAGSRLIHFKFEPMILHVLTASPEHAQLLLRCGLQAGFRESGAINLIPTATGEPVTPIVAIRSMGLALESLIGVQTSGGVSQRTVSTSYLKTLLRIANDRFVANTERIGRFRGGLLEATQPPRKKDGTQWEDAQARRERMRAEGLRRKAELLQQLQQQQHQGQSSGTRSGDGDTDVDSYTMLNADDAT